VANVAVILSGVKNSNDACIAEILPPFGRQNDGQVYRELKKQILRLRAARSAQDDSHGRELSEGELVGGFERRSADAADDGRAVAADERIIDFAGAARAPQAYIFGCAWGCRWI
jgi:hypothetical protein